jgi:hypothetical protein
VIALPALEGNIRCYSGVKALVIDEAARVPDELYAAVRPMLAVSGGSLIALTSAYARQGWYYTEWVSSNRWERVEVKATDCPRISPEFLREEQEALGPRVYAREYLCEWTEAEDQYFTEADIAAAFDNTLEPLFIGG